MNAYRLVEEAKAALGRETRVELRYLPIEVIVAGGALLLRGEVGNIAQKRVAADAVRAVDGLPRVVDQLRVRPTVRQGDDAIRDEVFTRLVQEPAFAHVSVSCRMEGDDNVQTRPVRQRQGTIDATISDGVTTLRGRVGNLADKRLAEVLAWKAAGSRDVANQLDVDEAAPDADSATRRVIERLIERSPSLRGARIEAQVHDGVVALRGRVQTAAAKQLLQHDVWYIDGVRDVADDVEVGHA